MAQLWKSFMLKLWLLHNVSWKIEERGCHSKSYGGWVSTVVAMSQVGQLSSQSARAQPESWEVTFALTSTLWIWPKKPIVPGWPRWNRIVMLSSRTQGRLQPTRSLADSITVPNVPQVATQETTHDRNFTGSTTSQLSSLNQVESDHRLPETPSSEDGANASHVANLLEDMCKYFPQCRFRVSRCLWSAPTSTGGVAIWRYTQQATVGPRKLLKLLELQRKSLLCDKQEIESSYRDQWDADMQHAVGPSRV